MFLAATFLLTKSPHIHPTNVAAKKNIFRCNEFAFTVQVKHKINSIQILGFILICLYYTTGHFHIRVGLLANNVAYFPFNFWLSFQRLCRLLWGCY